MLWKIYRAVFPSLLACLIFMLPVSAQRTPPTYTITVSPSYMRIWDALAPEQDKDLLQDRSLRDVRQTLQYVDGIGRPLQTVVKQGSYPTGGSAVDLVTVYDYDDYGRETYKYLPFGSTATNGTQNNGFFKTDAFQQQVIFYNTQLAGQAGETNIGAGQLNWAYLKSNYELSPADRVLSSYAPGVSWVGSEVSGSPGSGKSVKTAVYFNTTADSVHIWTVTDVAGSFGSYATSTNYAANTLIKTIVTDENGKQTIEFKDREGRMLLKKVQITAAADNGAGCGYAGWLSTCYIYDDKNNLRCVASPRAVDFLYTGGWNINGQSGFILSELCFRYEYDGRGRLTMKHIPGGGDSWMVYDGRDRLVVSQDANLRASNQWRFNKYDSKNRPIVDGLYTDNTHTSQSSMQAYLNSSGLALYENYNPSSSQFYTWGNSFPVITDGSNIMNYSFYDDYGWATWFNASYGAKDNSYDSQFPVASNSSYPYPQSLVQSGKTLNLATGSWSRYGATADGELSASFYDDFGRVIQKMESNVSGGTDISTVQYSFSGQVLQTVKRHQKSGSNTQTHTVKTMNSYDDLSRLVTTTQTINSIIGTQNTTTPAQIIVSNSYDGLGQLKNKSLGNSVDNINFEYNIRGWLLNMNKDYLTGGSSHYFGMELGYDKAASIAGGNYAQGAFNGNITGWTWKGGGDGVARRYDFSYDAASRLTGADFNQQNGSLFDKTAGVDFSVSGLAYDDNGNILTMRQRGLAGASSKTIDSLTYTYRLGGVSNRLQGVMDGTNDPNTLLGDFHYPTSGKGGVDYNFDGNGNITSDFNKGITSITYNYLNLPTQINFGTKGSISYLYDNLGGKVKKTILDNLSGRATVIQYDGEFIYQQTSPVGSPGSSTDTLQFMLHPEGRARWAFHRYTTGTTEYKWEYDFFEKDHLGNVREVLTQQRDTAQYLATMEAAYRSTENSLFYNIGQTNVWSYYVNGSSGPNPFGTTVTNPNDSVVIVSGSTPKEGPAIILKVMAGDVYQVNVQSFWKSGQTATGTTDAISEILSSLANGIVSTSGASKGSYSTLSNTSTSPLLGGVNAFRSANNPTPPSYPKAYLNYLALDDQFNYDASASGALGVGGPDAMATLGSGNITIKKNGYLYIYLTNETKSVSVFFDNLSVSHYSGPLLEETHYYPFGLTMAGISDKALKGQYAENKYRFNKGSELQNKEFSDGSGLEMYATNLRDLDPQLERWWQIDPKPNVSESPYAAMGNNPILHNDPLGDTVIIRYTNSRAQTSEVVYRNGKVSSRLGGKVKLDNIQNYMYNVTKDLNTIRSFNNEELNKRLRTLENSKQVHIIEMTDDNEKNHNTPLNSENDKKGIPTGTTTQYNPEDYINAQGMIRNPIVGLAHELLGHGYDSDQGKTDFTTTSNGIPMYEVNAVNVENRVRAKVGSPQKTTYGGQPIPINLLRLSNNNDTK